MLPHTVAEAAPPPHHAAADKLRLELLRVLGRLRASDGGVLKSNKASGGWHSKSVPAVRHQFGIAWHARLFLADS